PLSQDDPMPNSLSHPGPAVTPPLFLLPRRPPPSTLFPYTTLFRSRPERRRLRGRRPAGGGRAAPGAGTDAASDGSGRRPPAYRGDRKSTRLNSSHRTISYAVFCLKKKKNNKNEQIVINDSEPVLGL